MSRTERQRPRRATFRLPASALLFPVLLMFCVTPLATSGGAWAVVFVIPVLALAWVVVTRTKATPDGLTAYGLLGVKRMTWTELAGLELNDARWAVAVGLDGGRLRLPMVRPRDLPRLVAVSGGSLRLGVDPPQDGAAEGDPSADAGADVAAAPATDSGDAVAAVALAPSSTDRADADGADARAVDVDRAAANGADARAVDVDNAAANGAAGRAPTETAGQGALTSNAATSDRSVGRQSDIPADPGSPVR